MSYMFTVENSETKRVDNEASRNYTDITSVNTLVAMGHLLLGTQTLYIWQLATLRSLPRHLNMCIDVSIPSSSFPSLCYSSKRALVPSIYTFMDLPALPLLFAASPSPAWFHLLWKIFINQFLQSTFFNYPGQKAPPPRNPVAQSIIKLGSSDLPLLSIFPAVPQPVVRPWHCCLPTIASG